MIWTHRFPLDATETLLTREEMLAQGVLEIQVQFTIEDFKKSPGEVTRFFQEYRAKVPHVIFVWYLSYRDMAETMDKWFETPMLFNAWLRYYNMWNRWFYCIHLDLSAINGTLETHRENYLQIISLANRAFAPQLRLTLPDQ